MGEFMMLDAMLPQLHSLFGTGPSSGAGVRPVSVPVNHIADVRGWFHVMATEKHAQVAVMTLDPGAESGSQPEAHSHSDQVLLVTEGIVKGMVGTEQLTVEAGGFVIVPAGVKHRFWNEGEVKAVTFNVYATPAYPCGEVD